MKIHELNCDVRRKNVGFKGCVLDWKLIAGCFLFDNFKSFSASELASFQTTMQTLAWQDDKENRVYPVHRFKNPADATEDPTIQTFTDGSKAKVRDGVYDWTFQITSGGWGLLQALRSHASNGNTYVVFYDKQGQLLGVNSNGLFSTITLQIFDALPWKMNTGSETAAYRIHFVFDVESANENAEFAQADFDLTQIVGLQDIKIIVNSFNKSTGVANISLVTERGGQNLFDQYNTDVVAALFTAFNAETGGAITVSVLAAVPTTKTFNATISTADADFPHSGVISFSMVPPSLLSDAGIEGFEAEEVDIEVIGS